MTAWLCEEAMSLVCYVVAKPETGFVPTFRASNRKIAQVSVHF